MRGTEAGRISSYIGWRWMCWTVFKLFTSDMKWNWRTLTLLPISAISSHSSCPACINTSEGEVTLSCDFQTYMWVGGTTHKVSYTQLFSSMIFKDLLQEDIAASSTVVTTNCPATLNVFHAQDYDQLQGHEGRYDCTWTWEESLSSPSCSNRFYSLYLSRFQCDQVVSNL